MIDHELNELGRRLGLPGLSLNDEGRLQLDMDNVGSLSFERDPADPESPLTISLAVAVAPDEAPRRFEAALKRCDWRNAHALPLRAALHRDHLIYAVRIEPRQASAATLENAVRLLLAEAGL